MDKSVLLTAITLVVVGCAILAAYGFRGRVTTIGVDLGTTFSVVGININKKVTMIEDDAGVLFPSVVSYLDTGEILVGREATARLESNPANTIFNSKRYIGRSWNDDVVQQYGNAHPYKIVECDKSVSNHSTVAFEINLASGKKVVSPENVATDILKYLLHKTAKFLGHSQVNKAVIAVPAKFSPQQRIATGEAYKAAGLKVVRVIEEPTAAAVAYDLHKKKNVHHILVYDFGGGTLDVSLLYVAKGSVQVYATDGDEDLGGSDFDMCLYGIIMDKIKALYPNISEDMLHNSIQAMDSSSCHPATLRQKAEQIKKDLSNNPSAHLSCTSRSKQDVPTDISLTITNNEFHDGCRDLFDRSLIPLTRLLTDLGMSPSTIDEVVLVGGSTRIPLIKQQLKTYFNTTELNDRIDPDITVAYGAASIID